MIKIRIILVIFLISINVQANDVCNSALRAPEHKVIYPKTYSESTPPSQEKHIQFGFESEYTAADSENLLKAYMPSESITGLNKQQWLNLSHKERLDIMDSYNRQIFDSYRGEGNLVKITDDPELADALPDSFIYDSGNFEIILPPNDRVGELSSKIKKINNTIGIGSMQVTSSAPRESFFQYAGTKGATSLSDNIDPVVLQKMVDANMGYFNVVNDLDTFSKMAKGHARYLDTPEALTAKSFAHPWLGPMNSKRHKKLQQLIEEMASGRAISESEVSSIATNIDSHKFIGGSVFRPDVARKQNRMAIEIRNCHKNPVCLEEQLKREIYFFNRGKESFSEAVVLKQFDRDEAWSKLGNSNKSFLQSLFPKYSNYSSDDTAVYLNFSFPYRDWSGHVALYGDETLEASIKTAQTNYEASLTKIRRSLFFRLISKDKAKAQVQGALNKFIVESRLHETAQRYYKKSVGDDIGDLDFIKLSFYYFLKVNRFV